jgi:hypothetical protein
MKPSAPARIVLLSLAVFFVLAGCPAAAQDPDARHISVAATAGLATPLHGDFDFTGTAWQADVRFDTARYFGFGVFFEGWRHTEEDVFTDHRTRALGWNLVARGTASRVTVSGGGGVSYLLYSRDFHQTMSGCEPASLCRDSGQEFDNNAFAAQFQGGVDVGVAPHVAVMGQFRAIFPIEDPGGGHHTITGGVRVVF